jgi:multimeric flavodoxin WrbA
MIAAILNGGIRCGSTLQCVQLFLKEFSEYGEIEVNEIVLPKDMPHDCYGCNSCIQEGEATCPHSTKVKPIVDTLSKADLIIITSPVNHHDVTDHLKVLLDHLNYIWINHRPLPEMFHKIALTITASAGAGLSHASKTMKNSMIYWGVKRVYSFRSKVRGVTWEEVSAQSKKRIHRKVIKTAGRINRALEKGDKLHYPLARRIFFIMLRGMMKKNTWNVRDKSYWESQGWLGKNRPF